MRLPPPKFHCFSPEVAPVTFKAIPASKIMFHLVAECYVHEASFNTRTPTFSANFYLDANIILGLLRCGEPFIVPNTGEIEQCNVHCLLIL